MTKHYEIAGERLRLDDRLGAQELRPEVTVSSTQSGTISTDNSSTTPLDADDVFTGSAEDVTDFVEAVVSVISDVLGKASTSLVMQASSDGVTWRELDSYEYHDIDTLKTYKIQLPLKYFRVLYYNGSDPQTDFELSVKYQSTGGVSRSHPLGSVVDGHDDADLVKAALVAARIGSSDEYPPVNADASGNLFTTIGGVTQDAGGRVRVSQFTTLGDYKILGADRALLWENAGTGTGAFSANKYNMSVTAGQWYVRQTLRTHHYFSGKSQAIEVTFDNFQPEANVVKRVGYFSSNAVSPFDETYDGIWLESDGTTIRLKSARAGTLTLNKAITEWSGYANINSYATLATWQNFTVCLIDFLWLGGAVLRLWIKTEYGFILAHQFDYAGSAQDVFILTPNQPLRYEIRSTTGSGSFRYICAQVATEGSVEEAGLSRSVDTGTTALTLATPGTIYPLIALRKQTTFRDVVAKIDGINIFVASADTVRWSLQIDPTLSAPLTYGNIANSGMAFAVGNGTITVTAAGTVVASGYLTQNAPIPVNAFLENYLAYLGNTLNNTTQQYVLCSTPITNNVTAYASIGYKEY